MRKKRNIVIVLIVLILIIVLVMLFMPEKTKSFETDSGSVSVQKRNLYESVSINGKAVSDDIDVIFSDIDARIKEIHINKGDYVNEGDVICTVDISDLITQRDKYSQLLESYEKKSEINEKNNSINSELDINMIDFQISKLESSVNNYTMRYNNEIASINLCQSKQNELNSELAGIRNEINTLEAEIYNINILIEANIANIDRLEKNKEDNDNNVNDDDLDLKENQDSIDQDEQLDENISDDVNNDSKFNENQSSDNSQEQDEQFNRNQELLLENEKLENNKKSLSELEVKRGKLAKLAELIQNDINFYVQKQHKNQEMADLLSEYIKNNNSIYEQLKIQKNYSVSNTVDIRNQLVNDIEVKANYAEQINKLNSKINDCTIKATKSGIVTDIYVDIGDFASEKPVCQIQNEGKMHFEGFLSPNKIGEISKNNKILVSMVSNGFKEIEGKILLIGDTYDAVNNGYKLFFTVDNIDSMEIYPGFEASAKIIISEQNDVLTVPYDSIFEVDDKFYVRKLLSDNKSYEDVEVEKRLSTNYYIAVVSDDLKEKDIVLTGMIQ